MKSSIKVDGLLDLDQALKDLAEATNNRTAKGATRRALVAAAQPIFNAAQSGAPPFVKDSIQISSKLTPRQRRLARQGGLDQSALPLYIGATYEDPKQNGRLAHLFEFGTGRRKQKSTGRDTGTIRARPFMRPAWDANKTTALEILRKQLWLEIKRATERAARKAARAAAR